MKGNPAIRKEKVKAEKSIEDTVDATAKEGERRKTRTAMHESNTRLEEEKAAGEEDDRYFSARFRPYAAPGPEPIVTESVDSAKQYKFKSVPSPTASKQPKKTVPDTEEEEEADEEVDYEAMDVDEDDGDGEGEGEQSDEVCIISIPFISLPTSLLDNTPLCSCRQRQR